MPILSAQLSKQHLRVGGEQIQDLHPVRKCNDGANRFDVGEGCHSVVDGPTCAGNPHSSHILTDDLERV